MNIDGKKLIKIVVERLAENDIRCYDSAIVGELRELNTYELSQLILFGTTEKWEKDRKERRLKNDL